MDGPRRQPPRPPPASGLPSQTLTCSIALAAPSRAEGLLCPGQAGNEAEPGGAGSRRWANRSSVCPVAHGAPFWGSWSMGGWQENPGGSKPRRGKALCGTGYCSSGLVPADPPWQQAGVQPAAAPAGMGTTPWWCLQAGGEGGGARTAGGTGREGRGFVLGWLFVLLEAGSGCS